MAVVLLVLVTVLHCLPLLCLDVKNCAVDRHGLDVVSDIVWWGQEALPTVPNKYNWMLLKLYNLKSTLKCCTTICFLFFFSFSKSIFKCIQVNFNIQRKLSFVWHFVIVVVYHFQVVIFAFSFFFSFASDFCVRQVLIDWKHFACKGETNLTYIYKNCSNEQPDMGQVLRTIILSETHSSEICM